MLIGKIGKGEAGRMRIFKIWEHRDFGNAIHINADELELKLEGQEINVSGYLKRRPISGDHLLIELSKSIAVFYLFGIRHEAHPKNQFIGRGRWIGSLTCSKDEAEAECRKELEKEMEDEQRDLA